MNTEEIRAVLTICLLAAYADGDKHDREREQIRQVAQGLAQDRQVNLPGLYQEVLMRRIQLADVVPRLSSSAARQLAYEMAVCVCEADGQTSAAEQAFLARLREALGQAPAEFAAQGPQHGVAIEAVQAPVQQHALICMRGQRGGGLVPAPQPVHRVAVHLQPRLQGTAQRRIVFDQEDAHARSLRWKDEAELMASPRPWAMNIFRISSAL